MRGRIGHRSQSRAHRSVRVRINEGWLVHRALKVEPAAVEPVIPPRAGSSYAIPSRNGPAGGRADAEFSRRTHIKPSDPLLQYAARILHPNRAIENSGGIADILNAFGNRQILLLQGCWVHAAVYGVNSHRRTGLDLLQSPPEPSFQGAD